MARGDGLLVEDVRMRDAVDALDAGQAREFAVLVHVRRIERVGGLVERLGELPGEHHAELRGMDRPADARHRVVVEALVDLHHAARLRMGAVAPPHEGVDRGGVDARELQGVHDHGAAEGDLVVDVGELEEDGGVVEQVLLEDGRLVLEHAHLRRGGPRVDHKYSFHVDTLLMQVNGPRSLASDAAPVSTQGTPFSARRARPRSPPPARAGGRPRSPPPAS